MIDSPNKVIVTPTELLTNKTVYTLTGASASVWIICLVVHSILHKTVNSPDIYKVIALCLSLLISLSVVFNKKKKKYEDWLLSVINGFLIFIYATGFNSISKNIFLEEDKVTLDQVDSMKATSSITQPNLQLAGLAYLFEIDWFPNKHLVKENKILKNSIDSLSKAINQIRMIQENDSVLITENNKLKQRIHELKEKNKADNEVIRSVTSSTAKDKIIDQLSNEASELRNTNSNLRSQLTSTKTNYKVDSLRQSINKLISQQKKSHSLNLKETEDWRRKYQECMDSKEVH
jgi:hypothetical protein